MTNAGDERRAPCVVNLHIQAHSLIDLDALSKSDPFAVLYTRDTRGQKWTEVGRTETIRNCRDPNFVRSFNLPYAFEKLTEIRVEMYDRDSNSNELHKHDYIGAVTTALAQVVTSPGSIVTLEVRKENNARRKCGFMTLLAEEVVGGKKTVYLDLGVKIERKDSSLYRYVLMRSRDDGMWTPAYRSETSRSFNGVLRYKSCIVSGTDLSAGNDSRPLRIEIQKDRRGGQHETVGIVNTSLAALSDMPSEAELDVLAFEKQKQGGGGMFGMCLASGAKQSVRVGTLIIYKLNVVKEPTFLDFLAGGCKLSVGVAVDFTSSNGDPREKSSHHHVNYDEKTSSNQYETAIRVACGIVDSYVENNKYTTYGFGARLPPLWVSSHCFPLGDDESGVVDGVEGVVDAYRKATARVQLYGPTIFSEIIAAACEPARTKVTQDNQVYQVLFILTDGVIADMQKTIDKLVTASQLPFSVVIVGIGDEDFSKMRILDADDTRLVSNGKEAARDIVQFVSFNEFRARPDLLAKEMLAEIPNQVVEYFATQKIKPNPPKREHVAHHRPPSTRGMSIGAKKNMAHSNVSLFSSSNGTTDQDYQVYIK